MLIKQLWILIQHLSKLLPQFSDKQEIVSDQRIEIVWNTQDQNKEKIIEGEGQVVST